VAEKGIGENQRRLSALRFSLAGTQFPPDEAAAKAENRGLARGAL
jgi:hypothetical protein